MSDRILLDTNVLVYAYDPSDPEKQKRSEEILRVFPLAGIGMLSTQVLAEFYVAVTRKIQVPLSPAEAQERIEHFLIAWPVLEVTGPIVLEAVRGVRDHGFSYWDAQIWATALLNQVSVVFSEDFQHGRVIEGVKFVNPFRPNFQVDHWV